MPSTAARVAPYLPFLTTPTPFQMHHKSHRPAIDDCAAPKELGCGVPATYPVDLLAYAGREQGGAGASELTVGLPSSLPLDDMGGENPSVHIGCDKNIWVLLAQHAAQKFQRLIPFVRGVRHAWVGPDRLLLRRPQHFGARGPPPTSHSQRPICARKPAKYGVMVVWGPTAHASARTFTFMVCPCAAPAYRVKAPSSTVKWARDIRSTSGGRPCTSNQTPL